MGDSNANTGYSSCEDKVQTEAMARSQISSAPEQQRTGKTAGKYFQPNFSQQSRQSRQSQYPIKNLVQLTKSYEDDRSSSRSPSPGEGWHGPVLQRTRPVPVKYYGRLQPGHQGFSRDGWTEIPIQRI